MSNYNNGSNGYHPLSYHDPNRVKIHPDGTYDGSINNLNKSLTSIGIFGAVIGLGGIVIYYIKHLLNKDKQKSLAKIEVDKQKSLVEIEVDKQKSLAKIEVDKQKSLVEIEVDKQKSLRGLNNGNNNDNGNGSSESGDKSGAHSSNKSASCSSNELFSGCSTEPDDIWIVDGYMAKGLVNLLVAGGGVGKSILLTQIALAVAKGERPEFLPDTCQKSCKQPVFFYRIEHFPNELKGKYGEGKVFEGSGINWVLPENLSSKTLSGFLEHLYGLAQKISSDALVCADPATKLAGYNHEDFIRGVEEAQEIAKANGHTLTILASIHADETEDWKPFSSCNIKGGDKGFQQAGSSAVLRKERRGDEYRYLQCLKEPKGSPKPFDGKFLVMKKEKTQLDSKNSYLHFVHVDTKEEAEALPPKPKAQAADTAPTAPAPKKKAPNQKVTLEMAQKMMEMYAKGKTMVEIGKEVGLCEKRVSHYLKAFEAQKPDKH